MCRTGRPLLVAALLGAAGGAPAQPLPADLGWFATLAGSCWTGRFPDGTTEHTQCYTTQFGRLLRGTATLAATKDGKRELRFEGDSVFAWDGGAKRIAYSIWGSDGSLRTLAAHYDGDELVFPVPDRADPAKVAFRSVWRRIDDASFEVRRERPHGDGWNRELTVVYRKVPPAAAR
jgi:hypothetical protein